MNRQDIVHGSINILERAGFSTSDPSYLIHSGFDIVARRDALILVIKVMGGESISRSSLMGMVALARAVDGTPLIIGAGTSSKGIEDGVVYSRFSIPLMSISTLHDLFIEEVPPLIYSAPGGFYVRLDRILLAKIRQSGISLGELAEIAGVSRRTIQMYEEGMGAKLSAALRLEKALGVELIVPIDPFTYDIVAGEEAVANCFDCLGDNDLAMNIFEQLNEMGYSVEPTNRCPFDALTSDRENLLFTGVGIIDKKMARRAKAMASISQLLERHSVFFVDDRGRKTNLEGTPLITYGELERMRDKKKVLEIILERG